MFKKTWSEMELETWSEMELDMWKERIMKASSLSMGRRRRMVGQIGGYLGVGADGMVFEYGRSRVIKFCTRTARRVNFEKAAEVYEKVRDERLVKIYSYGELGRGGWYVIMQRLYELPNVDRAGVDDFRYRPADLKKMISGEKKVDDKRWAGLIGGLRRLKEAGYVYGDLHGGNVMMTKGGMWKVVDLEGFYYRNTRY